MVSSMQSGHRHFGLSGSIHLTLGELLRTTKIGEIETALARVDNLSRIRILPHLRKQQQLGRLWNRWRMNKNEKHKDKW